MADKLPSLDKAQREHHFVVVGMVDKRGRIVYRIDEGTTEARFSDGPVWVEPNIDEPEGFWAYPEDAGVKNTDDMLTKDLTATLKRRSREVRND